MNKLNTVFSTNSTVSLSNEIPSKQHNMNWQVIVSSTKIFSVKQPIECFKHKVLPVKAHVLSQENEHANITRAHVSPLFAHKISCQAKHPF